MHIIWSITYPAKILENFILSHACQRVLISLFTMSICANFSNVIAEKDQLLLSVR